MPRYNPFSQVIEESVRRADRRAQLTAGQQAAAPADGKKGDVVGGVVDYYGNLRAVGLLGITPLGEDWILS